MFQEALQNYLPLLLYAGIRSFVIFVVALGFVYMSGRMLKIVNSDRGRNILALIVIFPLSYWSILIYDMDILVHPWEIYWRVLVYASGSAVLFVLLGWRLFDRVDHLLDKKIAPDEEKNNGRKRSKK